MTLDPQDLVKILMAVAVGGAVGFEREFHDKAAGFRTLICICLGATVFTMLSLRIAGDDGDPGRIASYVVAGVGFLGGGVIMRDGGQIRGITTAATVWLVAALGIAIGGGYFAAAVAVSGVAMIVLWLFPLFERWVDRLYSERKYQVSWRLPADKLGELEALVRETGLRTGRCERSRIDDRMVWRCVVTGRQASHARLLAQLLADREYDEVRS